MSFYSIKSNRGNEMIVLDDFFIELMKKEEYLFKM